MTPGVDFVVVAVVDRTVVVGRDATTFVAALRAVRDAAARVAVVVAARDAVDAAVFVVALCTVVGRADTVRAVFAALARLATLRADVVVLDATARDAAARPDALRGLTVVGTTGATVVSGSASAPDWDVAASISISSVMNISGFSAAYCAIIS